jgi:ankyrin repeat protein
MNIKKGMQFCLIIFVMSGCYQTSLSTQQNGKGSALSKLPKLPELQSESQSLAIGEMSDFQNFVSLLEDEDTPLLQIGNYLYDVDNLQALYEYDEDMCNFIHYAASHGERQVVELLIEKMGVPINIRSSHGKTALHFAAMGGWDDVVSYLLSKGADLNMKDYNGDTPVYYCIRYKYPSLAKVFIESDKALLMTQNDDGYSVLHMAAGFGFTELIKILIKKQPELINLANNHGETPLHIAVVEDFIDAVRLLINKGAALDIKDSEGCTALDVAKDKDFFAQPNNAEIIKLLTEKTEKTEKAKE